MDSFNILPRFNGTLVHDFWKAYFAYDCKHTMLRKLLFLSEECGQKWSGEFALNLIEMKMVEEGECDAEVAGKEKKKMLRQRRSIMEKGRKKNPPQQLKQKKKGRGKRSEAQSLLKRFQEYENEVLRFFHAP